MRNDYWLNRWATGQTGWHQREVEPALVEHFGGIAPTRVLVPLCGKSMDMTWLGKQGHEVIGVELSELACETFFSEQGMSLTAGREGAFGVYRAKNITIYQGDFFAVTAEMLGQIGAVYDRGALIALPRDLRSKYAAHLQSIAKPKTFLQIVLERQGVPDDAGPPFSVTLGELESLYGANYRIEPLSREEVPLGSNPNEKPAECVYRLAPKAGRR
jgi:thiopurine S-methyltransferase